uniref:Ycf20-like protein n=3 Tax=Rhizophora mucronata TaxID=61149 RepID=A0A2P2JIE2_RHIMU
MQYECFQVLSPYSYTEMTTTFTFLNHPRITKFPGDCPRSRAVVLSFEPGFCQTAFACGRKLCLQCSFVHVDELYLAHSFRKMAWQIKSRADSSGLDPSASGSSGGTRLVRAIQSLQARLVARFQEIRRNLAIKLLFFLAGFYCATAFATYIGQTGDWDILSAGLAVVVVEVIGALMYRTSFPFMNKLKTLITMFNYWKTGLSLGLFLDSFKYEMDIIMRFSDTFDFEMDMFPKFF